MLIDELRELFKNMSPNINIITNYWENSPLEKRFKELENLSNQENFWQNPNQTKILKELQAIRNKREKYLEITKSFKELSELIELFTEDEKELKKISPEIKSLEKNIDKFKIEILLDNPEDSSNCFLNINSGAGGTESQDWANMLLRMYLRFCEEQGLSSSIVDYQPGEEAGIKSATLFIKGSHPYGYLKSEIGIHRLVRISPFDSNKRRHTSFAAIGVTPEAQDIEIIIDPKDLRIDTYRAGGAGGQHVNKTDSAVRITHIPTNTVVQCQNERSQTQNKETAMKMLKSKLVQKQKEEQKAKLKSVERKKIEWGSQIRSYVLHPYKLVKDHRTNYEDTQPDLVLDGNLMGFIENYLVWLGSN
jgi:peptide chain release factor 2